MGAETALRKGLFSMFRLIPLSLILALCLAPALVEGQEVKATYAPTDENFPNPERGFYYQTAYNPRPGQTPPGLSAGSLRK